jgi:RHS repeat-associated protein
MSCDITSNGFQQTAGYVVGPSGEQLTEVDAANVTTANPSGWAHTNIYAGGKLIGTYDGNVSAPSLHFYVDDPLGTRRAQISASVPGLLEATYLSLPFGDSFNQIAYAPGVTDPTENHFTGKERDPESGAGATGTGNDYFGARYYASSMGRFMSPDWSAKIEPVPYAKLANPQSLNLYAYVRNNPLVLIDADGHDWFNINNKWTYQDGKVAHDAQGNALSQKGYRYLLEFTKTGTNSAGAATGTLTFKDEQTVKWSVTGAFSGGADSAHLETPNGTYTMNLGKRSTLTTSGLVAVEGGVGLRPITGVQFIPASVPFGGGQVHERGPWGDTRIALEPQPGESGNRFNNMYLHSQYSPTGVTHNCICDGLGLSIERLLAIPERPTVAVEIDGSR